MVAVDILTRFVFAIPMASTTGRDVAEALLNNVFCLIGFAEELRSDRGTNFLSSSMAQLTNLFGIMTASPNKAGVYTLRINEYLNEDLIAQDLSIETLGVFTGLLNSTAAAPEMGLEYTGGTKARNKFGAQHMVVKLES